MIQLAEELGVSVEHCVVGSGLHGADLVEPASEIAGHQELSVLRNILRALGPEVPFSLLAGRRYRLATHGTWGIALMTCANVREALEVGTRYYDLSFSFNRPSYEIDARAVRFFYGDDENPEDLRSVLVERDMAALIAMQHEVFARTAPIRMLTLRGRRPAYAAAFEPLFGVAPRFGAEVNCIAIDVGWLEDTGPLADALGQRVCEQQCRALIEERSERHGLMGRVQDRLLRASGELPSMQRVAYELGMSARTLRSRLKHEATSYRDIVDGVRRTIAEELLLTTRMTVGQIAERLGYADASSFVSAFKRWKGVPPQSYRSGPGK